MLKFNYTIKINRKIYSTQYYINNGNYCFDFRGKRIVENPDLRSALSGLERKIAEIDAVDSKTVRKYY